ncbi:hypothetical protein ES319_A09G253600v1 [Gossypium barbadense]|uniref:TOG domain-containing protein n=3 Tax=Gossypium TaxID=3633 RepID=A0A5J5UME4_GOSBA|nr:hypothetical protein ES319_A09G253600v1 [Gossypium barbadense]TYH04196.1 hypothetical protein ES288_A09G279300v1 [Gossypium darwinii]TYI12420.1 hypothetical protein ES332_A09G276600v1 [Gossypium tomentosum]
MALRPIDNALPTTPERPKKQAKLSIPIQTQKKPSDFGVNEENKASPLPPPPPPADASVDYISSEKLKPFEDPESKIQGLVEGLESKDWVKVCESLNDVRRFSLHHSTVLLPTLEKVMLILVKAMNNPRSALCKTSIMAASDIFNAFGEKLLDFTDSGAFDRLLLQLLLKASQDKKFVCEEADKSLKSMVNTIAPLPLLNKLSGYVNHGNLRVRAKAAVSISNSVSKMGVDEIKEFGLVKLLQMATGSLNDRLPEAREAARSIVFSVYKAFTENEDENPGEAWQSFCQSSLSPIQAQSIIKAVGSQ